MSPHYKKTALLLSAIFLVGVCAIFFLLYHKITATNATADQAEMSWQTESNQREEIRWLQNSLKSIENEQAEVQAHFAQNSDIVPFLNTLEGLGTAAHAKAEVASLTVAKDNTSLQVGVNATGSFEAVYKFLVLLENSPYELQFDSINLESSDVDTGWTGNFKIRVLTFTP